MKANPVQKAAPQRSAASGSGTTAAASPTLELQRALGNRGFGQLLRQTPPTITPPKPKTDAEIWEEDWNDPAYAKFQNHFAGGDRPAGNKHDRYIALCPLYKRQGIARPMKYVADNIVTATFFGHKSPAHKDLAAALTAAEKTLREQCKTDATKTCWTTAPFTKMWAFNPRTTSEGNWSNHADGKAVDIDELTNPRMNNAGHRAIIRALTGYDMTKANPGAAGVDSYDAIADASSLFQDRYSSTGMADRLTTLTGQQTTLEDDEKKIKDELAAVPTGKKATKDDKTKAAEITKRLKAKQAEVKDVSGQVKTLTAEKKRYDAIDAKVGAAEKKVKDLEEAIAKLAEEAKTATGADVKKNATATKTKTGELAKAKKELDKALSTRSGDTLRGWADRGFLDLKRDLVDALRGAGLTWGGDWGAPYASKDIMHFQVD